MLKKFNVIGSPVTMASASEQLAQMRKWSKEGGSKFICVANVHMLIEAHKNSEFCKVLHRADIVTPDGMPLVWMLRILGQYRQDRLPGLDILINICNGAAEDGVGVYFIGSTNQVLSLIRERLEKDLPGLRIAGMESPPFRPLTVVEDEELVDRINSSGAGVVLVALGCPKQEIWMDLHRGRVQAVMIGLGGAFPVFAGLQKRAPLWMRSIGMEWIFRLAQEPRRLWRRYWQTNLPFLYLAGKQIVASLLKNRS